MEPSNLPHHDPTSWDAIDRYLAGQCTPQEAAIATALLASYGLTGAQVKHAVLRAERASDQAPAATDAWQALIGRLETSDQTEVPHLGEPKSSSKSWIPSQQEKDGTTARFSAHPLRLTSKMRGSLGQRSPRWRAAWIAAGCVVAALMLVVVGLRESVWRVPPVPSQVYATSTRQRSTFVLSDGSRVTLAPRTRLTVSAGFGQDNRLVQLEGHAYFDVAHTAGRPFTVQTGRVATRVLGTAFDIAHYADDRDVRVVVLSGKVAMTTSRRAAVTLVPGMMGRVTDSTTLVTAVDDISSYQTWTRGPLEFRNVPVRDVLQAVGHWYDLRFTLTDTTLATQRITTFLDYSSTRDLIAALETVLGVTATSSMTSDGQVVTLRPRLQTVRPAPRRRDGIETFSSHSEVGR